MVLSWAHKQEILPTVIAHKLAEIGGHVRKGTTWEGMAKVARNYGYTAEIIDKPTHKQISDALDDGPVIVMGPNKRNHILVIVGKGHEGGFFKVVDPLPRWDHKSKTYKSTDIGGIDTAQGILIIRRQRPTE
jgi:hypothetical protein